MDESWEVLESLNGSNTDYLDRICGLVFVQRKK
jgi:hypothetical protein